MQSTTKLPEGGLRRFVDYFSASSKEEIDSIIPEFAKPSDKPMFLEVFTDMEKDAKLTNEFFHNNRIKFGGIKASLLTRRNP